MNFPLVGNSKIKTALTNSIKENRLPHAILIEGDKGTGKHTLANFIAMAAVCENSDSPCENCKNCNLAKNGNHPDIYVTALLDGKKKISVSQIREVKSKTFIKPHTSKRKVFIIDSAQTMNPESQNALLKVLEEPESDAIFILITESKLALLETVISRCIVLTLNVPKREDAAEYISSVTDFEFQKISEALDNSNNNIGKALSLLENNKTNNVQAAVLEFLDFFCNSQYWDMLITASRFEKNRIEAEEFFKNLKSEIVARLRVDYNGVNAKSLTSLYSCVCELETTLEANINLNLLFCALVSRAKAIINNN